MEPRAQLGTPGRRPATTRHPAQPVLSKLVPRLNGLPFFHLMFTGRSSSSLRWPTSDQHARRALTGTNAERAVRRGDVELLNRSKQKRAEAARLGAASMATSARAPAADGYGPARDLRIHFFSVARPRLLAPAPRILPQDRRDVRLAAPDRDPRRRLRARPRLGAGVHRRFEPGAGQKPCRTATSHHPFPRPFGTQAAARRFRLRGPRAPARRRARLRRHVQRRAARDAHPLRARRALRGSRSSHIS